MTFDIATHWGSHARLLAAELAVLPAGSLVIEHGAGLYSSPLIADQDVRVVCVEDAPGWRSWATWFYGTRGVDATIVERAKETVKLLESAALVFIDGAERERGDLLKWALTAGVLAVIAHDTEDDMARRYSYHRHLATVPGYVVTHDGSSPRTTLWKRA